MKKRRYSVKKLWILVAVFVLCACLTACNSSDYKEAEEMYNNGDYAAALELYNALGEYEDSQEKAKSCQYSIANSLFEDAKYEDALDIYKELGKHEDSEEKVKCCLYAMANGYFENTQYGKALALYEELGEYEESAEYTAICNKEIGMTANSDYDFLTDIEASVLGRMAAADGTSYTNLVNTELAYLEKYSEKSFYDDRLQEIASKYIDGLYIQRDALKTEYEYEHQLEWQRGMVLRYEALTYLYDEYDFLADNNSFVATYVMQYEDKKALLEAYEAIEADISAQTHAADFSDKFESSYGGGTISFTLKNNTQYTYSTMFEFSFVSSEGTIFYSNSALIENIKPDQSYVVAVYVDFANCTTNQFHYLWNNYYVDVQY